MASIEDIRGISPVLLGNIRTNKLIDKVSQRYQFGNFGYFVDAKDLRTVEVRPHQKWGANERANLAKFKPIENSNGSMTLRDDVQPNGYVFAVVTRMPHPQHKEDDCITVLSAGYSKVLEKVAAMLTDEKQMAKLISNIGLRPDAKFPRYFQGLFSIRLAESNPDSGPKDPALRCFRAFEEFSDVPLDPRAKNNAT